LRPPYGIRAHRAHFIPDPVPGAGAHPVHPSEIKAISYFTNLLLFSAFFGLGLGCILWKREVSPYLFAVGLTLIFAFVMVSGASRLRDARRSALLAQADQRFKLSIACRWLRRRSRFSRLRRAVRDDGSGAREGDAGASASHRYAYDLIGSFLGTILFALLSYLGTPPGFSSRRRG